jgi:ketosteroid isomerase-like protein
MSQENVEIVRRCTEHWANRDLSAITEILDPNAVLDLSRNVLNPDVYRGVDGFRRWVENVDEVWERLEPELEEIIDGDDHVVTAVRMSGRGRGSGAEVDMRVFQVWQFREGKLLRLTGGYRDRDEALEAAGLRD